MTKIVAQNGPESPFEKIKHVDEQGEYWLAREMQELMEYALWQKFQNTIERAVISCKNSGQPADLHFIQLDKSSPMPNGGFRKVRDYRLSRHACNLIAMASDPDKKGVALAQAYFSVQTLFAEAVQKRLLQNNIPTGFTNNLWLKRSNLFLQKTKIPTDKFCVFEEISHTLYTIEMGGMRIPEHAIPDGSVGGRWKSYARDILHLDMSLVKKYPHHYPDNRGIVSANIYPLEWQGMFTRWFREVYIPTSFPEYMKHLKMDDTQILQVMKILKVEWQIPGKNQRQIKGN